MTEVTLPNIQLLLDRPKGEGMIVSCYADLSLAGYQSTWWQRLKNEVGRLEQRLAGDPEARRRFTRDMAAIRRVLEQPAARRSRGLAVFSNSARDFLQTFALSVPVRDTLVLDEQPYLVPLLETIHRQRRYLVVLTDSHRGRIYAAEWGRVHLLSEIAHEVPRRQRSAGETWGKQQATIARHREDHILHYRKALVRQIEAAWGDAPFRGLILLGEHETLAAVRADLPPSLASQVIHDGPHSWVGRQPSITAKVQDVLDAALRAHDDRLVDELERRLREKSYCVAAGPQEVIDALRNGQVGYPGYVILEPDRGEAASRCTECGSVLTVLRDACPFCQAPCEKVNLWQEILLFAARHDIPAHVVESHPALARHGGVLRETGGRPQSTQVSFLSRPRSFAIADSAQHERTGVESMSRKLYVGNLPYETGEAELQELFGQCGSVESVRVMRDMATGRARGFAFVEMATDGEAQTAAAKLNGQQLGGRTLVVNEARPKPEYAGGGFGGGRGSGGGRREPRW